MSPLFLIPTLFGLLALSTQAQQVEQLQEDGSAAAYTDSESGKIITPTIEVKNGKRYYNWPMWNKFKNRKMQVHRERTNHPGAQWWPHAGLGLFMHWGIVSEFEPSGEAWSGRWRKNRPDAFHPQSEIWAAAETFNPTNYDPNEWMAGARRAGFRYSVITTKHHDGYALWDSDHALMGVRQSLDGKCLIAPFVEACHKNDVKVGFYYSGMDWYYDRHYMNYAIGGDTIIDFEGKERDKLPLKPASHVAAFQQFNQNQVEELITRFKPDIWWGDGGHGASLERIRELHPPIVINNRGLESGDHATPEGFQMADPRFIRKPVLENGWWWELCTIIQGGSWHYDIAKGEKINKTDAVLRALAEVRCLGGNLLANIGPRPDGTFPDEVWRLFDEMAEWMETNEASVFDINGGGPWPEKCNVPITAMNRTWYFHAKHDHATLSNPVVLKDCPAEPRRITLMRTGDSIEYTYRDRQLRFSIPQSLKAIKVTDVVKVEFGLDFDPEPYRFKHW